MNFYVAPIYTKSQLAELDEAQIHFPFSDEDARYIGSDHQYELTAEYFEQRGRNLEEESELLKDKIPKAKNKRMKRISQNELFPQKNIKNPQIKSYIEQILIEFCMNKTKESMRNPDGGIYDQL